LHSLSIPPTVEAHHLPPLCYLGMSRVYTFEYVAMGYLSVGCLSGQDSFTSLQGITGTLISSLVIQATLTYTYIALGMKFPLGRIYRSRISFLSPIPDLRHLVGKCKTDPSSASRDNFTLLPLSYIQYKHTHTPDIQVMLTERLLTLK
jgi:hypothetical protein